MTQHTPWPPDHVRTPVMRMEWTSLTFLHWRYLPDQVQRLLPDGLEVETYDGSAWVGLVPFRMRVWAPVGPSLPWMGEFPETNVRTYARDAEGSLGVWFLSLDAARLPAVVTARTAWGLPYYWARMSLRRDADTVGYSSRRRWPDGAAHCSLTAHVGPTIPAGELDELDHYLTARFALWSTTPAGLLRTPAEHPPWTLRRVDVDGLETDLLTAAGLPAPVGTPVTHFSDGVQVRVGRPRRVRP